MAKKKSKLWKDLLILGGGFLALGILPTVLDAVGLAPEIAPVDDQGDEDEF